MLENVKTKQSNVFTSKLTFKFNKKKYMRATRVVLITKTFTKLAFRKAVGLTFNPIEKSSNSTPIFEGKANKFS